MRGILYQKKYFYYKPTTVGIEICLKLTYSGLKAEPIFECIHLFPAHDQVLITGGS